MTAITGRYDGAITILAPLELARRLQAVAAVQEASAMCREGEVIMAN
jgi:hypothetical protein